MRARLVLPILLFTAACTRAPSECARSVESFRATLRSDPTLAAVPDFAIDLARAHRSDASTACVLANGYADDAERARRNPPQPSPASSSSPDSNAMPGVEAAGTPRTRFEITPHASPETTPIRPAIDLTPRTGPRGDEPGPTETPAVPLPKAAETADAAPTVNASAACRRDCESVAYPLARTACEQRCDGATPLPGASAPPVIVH